MKQTEQAGKALLLPLRPDELLALCRERLDSYKVPRQIEFRSELPKNFVGKVLRRLLVET